MKQFFIPQLLLSMSPITMVAQTNIISTTSIQSESLACESIASIETNVVYDQKEEIKYIPTQETQVPKKNIVLSPTELDPLFEKYALEYGVNSTILKIIAKCESGYNSQVISKNGLYGGLYQYSTSTWISTRKAMGLDENPELRFNAEETIKTTAFKIANGGIGAWPTCGKKALGN